MPRKGQKLTPEQRQKISESRKHLTPEQRENIAAAQRGMKRSLETRAKMSAAHMGHSVSDAAREAIGNAHRGKTVSEESRERNRVAHLGRPVYQSTRDKMSAAHMGEKNGFFGKHHTEETLKKLTGRPFTETHCQNISEAKHGVTPANIEILKQSRIGAVNSEEHRRKVSLTMTGIVRSEETKQKISENRSGINCGASNAAWNGGSSYFPYCPKFNERRKKAVRNFFDNHCICCGKNRDENMIAGKPRELSVHHIDHDKTQGCHGTPFNLVPLCHDCHNDELTNQEDYKKYINQTLDSGFEKGIWSREQYERDVMYPDTMG